MQKIETSLRLSRRQVLALAGMVLVRPFSAASGAVLPLAHAVDQGHAAEYLRCEYREDPLGVDAVRPRLSWTMSGAGRGARQTAYQVRVASSAQALARGRGNLWDSGRVPTDQSAHVVYAGRPLASRTRCHWQVRLWDEHGRPTGWSKTAFWTVGLLHPSDWKGQWISDAALAAPQNRPRTPIHCYRSEIAHSPTDAKWIVLDLGAPKTFDGACLQPAKPDGISFDIATILYPVRFILEAANAPDFHDATPFVVRTDRDVRPPRPSFTNPERYRFPAVTARYIRLAVSRLAFWDGADYALALGRFQVFAGDTEIAAGATVTASDSVEIDGCSRRFLTDPQSHVAYETVPPVLLPHLGGVDSVSRVPLLRREFKVEGGVRSATLYCAARGFYEAWLNGSRISEDVLAGGYTEYDSRIQYQAYDVVGLLKEGPNVLGALLGYGWYAGRMNISDNGYIYGYFPQLLAQLEIEYVDGHRVTIGSDAAWKSTLNGPTRWSDLLDGEGYDCRRETPGWDKTGFDAQGWAGVTVIPRDATSLVWQRAQPVRRMQNLQPVSVRQVTPGVFVFDLGQEISGWCRVQADGPAGTHLTIRHAEERHPDGTLNRDNLWGTAAEEYYVLDGRGTRALEPHFTTHGFRFVEVTGLTHPPTADAVTGIHVRTAARQVGRFHCSNPLFNRLMDTSRWTQQNLLFDVPAGCAGRSERLAWTGDIRPCVQTALFHFDTAAFFEKYAADLRADQTSDGRFTDICPHAHLRDTEICVGSPGWADAGVSLPWDLYQNTGDPRILSDHYESARRWVDFVHSQNPNLIWTNRVGMGWGDWLSGGPATPAEIGSTAFFAHNADLLARMAAVLGHEADAVRYRALFQSIRDAFAHRFVTPEGCIKVGGVADVTDLVRAKVRGTDLTLIVGNDTLGGDPALGVTKHLRLTYRIGSHEETRDYLEGVAVSLTGPAIQVLKAFYGGDSTDVQGSYALALHFGLLDEPLHSRAVEQLAQVIQRGGGHPTTGFWSSVELLLTLTENDRHDVAARMLALTTAPSWGHMVQGDGTTCWESFDADVRQLSLNHWTHSAIGEWLWRHVAGIAPDPAQPGYRAVVIRPRLCAEVSACEASYESQCGPISVAWEHRDSQFTLAVTLPANTSATVHIPAADSAHVTEGGRLASTSPGVRLLRRTAGECIYRVVSGTYRFSALASPRKVG